MSPDLTHQLLEELACRLPRIFAKKQLKFENARQLFICAAVILVLGTG